MTIPRFDFGQLDTAAVQPALRDAAERVGFLIVGDAPIARAEVEDMLDAYRRFFARPEHEKALVDMAATASNRGWGRSRSEQVNPDANPDFKEVFDSGVELAPDDPLRSLRYYAPNRWPDDAFAATATRYFQRACAVAFDVLEAVTAAIGMPGHFTAAFDRPMALLRGNRYPARPADAGHDDFGIAPHTDYGCLTLLATDGSPGLELRGRDGAWHPVAAPPGDFIVNFGEMLETWTAGRIVATEHRVVGTDRERLSVPLFFNPSHDVNVAPPGSGLVVLAGDHLAGRYDETYVHRQRDRM